MSKSVEMWSILDVVIDAYGVDSLRLRNVPWTIGSSQAME